MPIINASGQTKFGVRPLPFIGLLSSYGSTNAAYSLRKLGDYTGPAVRVRRSSDNQETDISFNIDGTLNTTQLLNFTKPSAPTFKILDNYTSASVAFSLRKVRTVYTGAAIRVRRSDNQESDIGFDANGDLDTTALLNFVGSGDGFVAKWYDQSGNNDYAYNNTATSQPRIVIAGVVVTSGNRPAIYWDNSRPDLLRINTKAWSGVNNIRSSFVSMKWVTGTGNTPIFGQTSDANYHPDTTGANLILSAAYASNNIKYGALYLNGQSKTLNQFSKSIDSNILVSMIQSSQIGYFNLIGNDRGYAAPAGYFKGYYSEIIIYGTDQTSNRSLIESNINGYYSIYGDAYVTKWYDQSGSNRHAEQITSTYQPQIVSGCSLILRSNKPAIYFDGVDDTLRLSTALPLSDINTLFAVAFANYENSSNDMVLGRRAALSYRFGGGNGPINSLCITRTESSDILYGSTPAGTAGLNTLAVFHTYSLHGNYDGLNRSRIYSNGVWRNDGNAVSTNGFAQVEYIGSMGDGQYFKNTIQEVIYYPNTQLTNRIGIETNINNYYSLWNRGNIVTSNLVHNLNVGDIDCYPRSGTELFDLNSNSLVKGTLTGSPTFNTSDNTFTFANNKYIRATTGGVTGNSARTVSVWFKINGLAANSTNWSTTDRILFALGSTTGNNLSFAINVSIYDGTNTRIEIFGYNTTYDEGIWLNNVNLGDNTWRNLSVTWDGTNPGTLKVFLNGVFKTSLTRASGKSYNTSAGYMIGTWIDYNRYLTDRFGGALVYNRVLTDSEILQNFNATKTRYGL